MPPAPRRHPRARTTAFAMQDPVELVRVSSAASRQVKDLARRRVGSKPEAWQAEAYRLVEHDVAEAGYVIGLKSDAVSLGQLAVQEWDHAAGRPVSEHDSKRSDLWEKSHRVMRYLEGPNGGHEQILRSGAYHHQVAGEAHFVGEVIADGNPPQFSWSFLSVLEVVDDGSKVTRQRSRSSDKAELGDDTFTARYHVGSGTRSYDPTSTIYRVLPILREIAGITEAIDSMVNSRIAAGMLAIPSELSVTNLVDEEPSDDVDGGEDDMTVEDAVINHMIAPLENPASGARFVPLVVSGPAEALDKIRYIGLAKPADLFPIELREKALDRLAKGLDAPPSVMNGVDRLNHWNVYAVDNDLIRNHVRPIGRDLARFLTTAYLQKMLMHFEDVDPVDARRMVLKYDISRLIARPNVDQAARELHDAMLLSDAARVRVAGFEPDDMPSDEELRVRTLRKFASQAPATAVNQGVFRLLGVDIGADPDRPIAVTDEGGVVDLRGGEGVDIDESVESVDPMRVQEPERRDGLTARRRELSAEVKGLADASYQRAVERAGAVVANRARKNPELRARFDTYGGRAHDLLCELSTSDLQSIGVPTADRLFDGVFEQFRQQTVHRVQTLLVSAGADQMAANEAAHRAASDLVNVVAERCHKVFRSVVPLYEEAVTVDEVDSALWSWVSA